jgi:hypothetical protein
MSFYYTYMYEPHSCAIEFVLFIIYQLLTIYIYIYIYIYIFKVFVAVRSKTIKPVVQLVLNSWTNEVMNRRPCLFDLQSSPNNFGEGTYCPSVQSIPAWRNGRGTRRRFENHACVHGRQNSNKQGNK